MEPFPFDLVLMGGVRSKVPKPIKVPPPLLIQTNLTSFKFFTCHAYYLYRLEYSFLGFANPPNSKKGNLISSMVDRDTILSKIVQLDDSGLCGESHNRLELTIIIMSPLQQTRPRSRARPQMVSSQTRETFAPVSQIRFKPPEGDDCD